MKNTELSQKIEKAKELAMNSEIQVPACNHDLMKLIEGLKVGEGSAEIMKAYSKIMDTKRMAKANAMLGLA